MKRRRTKCGMMSSAFQKRRLERLQRYGSRRKAKRKHLRISRWEVVIPGVRVTPPKTWCLLENPVASLDAFFKAERLLTDEKRVAYDLDEVELMDIGTALLLHSQFERWGSRVVTTLPRHRRLKRFVASSGLFSKVRWLTPTGVAPPSIRKWLDGDAGIIQPKTATVIDPDLAETVQRWAANRLQIPISADSGVRDPRLRSLYRTLVEAMSNTVTHAGDEEMQVKWWVAATRRRGDDGKLRLRFAFMDLGKGIVETARLHWLRGKLALPNPPAILSETMTGGLRRRVFKSSTGRKRRGKGLPKMTRDARQGHLKRLFVMANGAYADVTRNKYKRLPTLLSFNGSFLSWEIEGE